MFIGLKISAVRRRSESTAKSAKTARVRGSNFSTSMAGGGLSLRLFANMFAGHLLLLVFILGGEHLLQGVIGLKLISPFAFSIGIVLTFFEFMVQCLQAYIFTLLTALYIAGALADEH